MERQQRRQLARQFIDNLRVKDLNGFFGEALVRKLSRTEYKVIWFGGESSLLTKAEAVDTLTERM